MKIEMELEPSNTITFNPDPINGKLSATLTVRNISTDRKLAIKLKTNAAKCITVKPKRALIGNGEHLNATLHLNPLNLSRSDGIRIKINFCFIAAPFVTIDTFDFIWHQAMCFKHVKETVLDVAFQGVSSRVVSFQPAVAVGIPIVNLNNWAPNQPQESVPIQNLASNDWNPAEQPQTENDQQEAYGFDWGADQNQQNPAPGQNNAQGDANEWNNNGGNNNAPEQNPWAQGWDAGGDAGAGNNDQVPQDQAVNNNNDWGNNNNWDNNNAPQADQNGWNDNSWAANDQDQPADNWANDQQQVGASDDHQPQDFNQVLSNQPQVLGYPQFPRQNNFTGNPLIDSLIVLLGILFLGIIIGKGGI